VIVHVPAHRLASRRRLRRRLIAAEAALGAALAEVHRLRSVPGDKHLNCVPFDVHARMTHQADVAEARLLELEAKAKP
jgi:hypothetical protein